MKRALLILLLLAAFAISGCSLEEIIKSYFPVGPTDGEVWVPDGLITDGDMQVGAGLTVNGIKPAHGPFVGGTEAYITGTAFDKTAVVRVGGITVSGKDTTLVSPHALKVTVPAGKVGLADVEVTLPASSSKATLARGYTYDPVYLDPASGPVAGGTLVTLHTKGMTLDSKTTLTLGGKAMTGLTVLSTSAMRAQTPTSDITGPVTLVIQRAGGAATTVEDAYTYYQASSPRKGGLGGGPLKGTLTVTVLNTFDRSVVPGARVVVGKERILTLTRVADGSGTAVFSDTRLTGEVSLTAGLKNFESASILSFDARDVTIFLTPLPSPQPGPLPPGQSPGVIRGSLMFGGVTGVGDPNWKLVPEPKSKDQVKRAYVYATVPSMAWGAPSLGSGTIVDFADDGSTAWEYVLYGRTGGMAVYAVAGIYNKTTSSFQPYVMGLTRGVVVGPGDTAVANIKVVIPLTEKVTLRLKDAPPALPRYLARLAIDLGADGLLMRPDSELTADGVPASLSYGRLPAFNHQGLIDATYTAEVQLSTNYKDSQIPLSVATVRMNLPKGGEILVDQFLGPPLQVKPGPGGKLLGNTLAWTHSGGTASLNVIILRKTDQTPVWRFYSPGKVTMARLPDPATVGLPAWPSGPLVWVQYLARLPGFSFDTFNYSHLSTRYWDRYSYDTFSIQGP